MSPAHGRAVPCSVEMGHAWRQLISTSGISCRCFACPLGFVSGCQHPIPVMGHFQGTANVAAQADVRGEMAIKLPAAIDPGPMVASVIRPARDSRACSPARRDRRGRPAPEPEPGRDLRFRRESGRGVPREARGRGGDAQVAAVVLRINSPGGGVTACDIMAEELDRFKAATRKPVVACLMDVATSGAYYLALGADRIVAHPTSLTGGIGVVFNHVNLQDAMAQLNVTDDPIKAGTLIDMGSVTEAAGAPDAGALAGDGRRLPAAVPRAGRQPQAGADRGGSPHARRRPDRRRGPGARSCIWSIGSATSRTRSARPSAWPGCRTPRSCSTTGAEARPARCTRSHPVRRG